MNNNYNNISNFCNSSFDENSYSGNFSYHNEKENHSLNSHTLMDKSDNNNSTFVNSINLKPDFIRNLLTFNNFSFTISSEKIDKEKIEKCELIKINKPNKNSSIQVSMNNLNSVVCPSCGSKGQIIPENSLLLNNRSNKKIINFDNVSNQINTNLKEIDKFDLNPDWPGKLNRNHYSLQKTQGKKTIDDEILTENLDAKIKRMRRNENPITPIAKTSDGSLAHNLKFESFLPEKYRINQQDPLVFLVIDDNIHLRTSIKNVLRVTLKYLQKKLKIEKEFEILEGADGIDALKLVIDPQISNHIQGIFIDENMEYINGSEAIKIIRNLQKLNKIKKFNIATVTAFEDVITRNNILNAGVDEIIQKPLQKHNLEEYFQRFPLNV